MKYFVVQLAVPIQHWEQGKRPPIRIRRDSADFFLMKRLKDVVKMEWAVLIPVLQEF